MSDFDDKKNNKKPTDDGSTVDTTAVKKPIGDGLVITTVTARTVIFCNIFWPKAGRPEAR